MAASFNLTQYIERYPASLNVARTLQVAEVLLDSRSDASLARDCLTTALGQMAATATCAPHYREVILMFFERYGVELIADEGVVRQIETRDSVSLGRCQEQVGKARQAAEVAPSLTTVEKLVECLLDLAAVLMSRGDLQRSFNAFSDARSCASESSHLLVRVLEAQVKAYYVTTGGRFGPLAADSVLQTLKEYAKLPVLQGISINTSRPSDERSVFYTVANALSALERRDYRTVASVLVDLNRYPTTNALPPQTAAEYSQLAASYFAQLPKLVLATELTNLRDLVSMAILCVFATFSRSEVQAVVSLGYVKGWLEEDAELNAFTNHMIACRYLEALKSLGTILSHTSFQYELFSSRKSGTSSSSQSHQLHWHRMICEAALQQYAAPYVTLSIPSMEVAFGWNAEVLENYLRHLIEQGRLQCRIDTPTLTLKHKEIDQQYQTLQHVAKTGERVIHERLMCARAQSLLRNNVILNATVVSHRKDMTDPRRRLHE